MYRRSRLGQSMISTYLSINKKLSVYDQELKKYLLKFVVSCSSKPESGNMIATNHDHCSNISERKL